MWGRQHGTGKDQEQGELRTGWRWVAWLVRMAFPLGPAPLRHGWGKEQGKLCGSRGQRKGPGEGVHSHLRSSRLLLGQARCWPGGLWVLWRQASMAELGASSGTHSAAGSL